MLFHATTTIDILRGETLDEYGDTVPASGAAYTGIPAHITETTRVTSRPADGEPRVIRRYTIRVPGTADLVTGDRVRDADGNMYMVDSFSRSAPITGTDDLRIEARRVT